MKRFINNLSAYFTALVSKSANGLTVGKFQYIETAKGGISVRHPETSLRNFIAERRKVLNDITKRKNPYTMLEVAEKMLSAKSIESLLTFAFDGEGELVKYDADTRNKRIHRLNIAVKRSFAPVAGELDKGENLSTDALFMIVQDAAAAFIAITAPYAKPKAKAKRAVKVTKKADVVAKPRRSRTAPQPSASV